ncbi:hypothetical protein ALI22I_08865 [Saccharothrix sp. ALI-22-I]|nr:hypothetical protein ALI22I_08865 [Saccharothrix sp. ALI-22-I]
MRQTLLMTDLRECDRSPTGSPYTQLCGQSAQGRQAAVLALERAATVFRECRDPSRPHLDRYAASRP